MMFGVNTFAYKEIRSALRLYFEPLVWALHSSSAPFVPKWQSDVKDDWRAWLPEKKDRVFRNSVRQLEVSYNVFTVSLDEALGFLNSQDRRAIASISVASDLCASFAKSLTNAIRVLRIYTSRLRRTPSVANLDPRNFQSSRGQRAARLSSLESRVLHSQRDVFLYKAEALAELTTGLREDFLMRAARVADQRSPKADSDWTELDADHYDLNTCLRETIVMMKSFLMTLPDNQLTGFGEEIDWVFSPAAHKDWSVHLSKADRPKLLTAEEIAYARRNA